MANDAQVFKYITPADDFESGRKVVTLCQTDHIYAAVNLIKEGGETRLHMHQHFDGFWMVLSGRARFYGDDDVVLGEFGKYEGILIPRFFKYWFESASDEEPLELMQIEAADVSQESFFTKPPKSIIETTSAIVATVPG